MNFDNLFRYHYRPLCLYAIHYIHDVDAAEDIVQECFFGFVGKNGTGRWGDR